MNSHTMRSDWLCVYSVSEIPNTMSVQDPFVANYKAFVDGLQTIEKAEINSLTDIGTAIRFSGSSIPKNPGIPKQPKCNLSK